MKARLQSPTLQSGTIVPPRSACAPSLLAAYAIGASLWTPLFVLAAGPFERALATMVPGLAPVSALRMCAVLWILRFALYAIGAARRWDYGYGINGVIVNRRLSLDEKVRRIARDWFGLVLAAVWIGFMATALIAAVAGQ
jgi:hypothetical protein